MNFRDRFSDLPRVWGQEDPTSDTSGGAGREVPARFPGERLLEIDDTALDRVLREASVRGRETPLVYVDARSMPGAVRLSGRYEETAEGLRVVMRVRLGERSEVVTMEALPLDPDDAAKRIADKAIEMVGQMQKVSMQ